MKVLVSDSSILIEFSNRELLDKMFHLEFQFAVPDLLFHEELIDLGAYSRQDLLGFGLRVESLDSEGVEMAIVYQPERPALSLVDTFALALADRQGWHLLTEDRTMRSVAQSKGSYIGMRYGSSTTCWMPAFYRRPRSWRCLKPCGTIRGVPFPKLT